MTNRRGEIMSRADTPDRCSTRRRWGGAKIFPDYQFVVAQAPSVEDQFYKDFTSNFLNVGFIFQVILQ